MPSTPLRVLQNMALSMAVPVLQRYRVVRETCIDVVSSSLCSESILHCRRLEWILWRRGGNNGGVRTASAEPIIFFDFMSAHDSLAKLLMRHPDFELQQFALHALTGAHQLVMILTLDITDFFQAPNILGCTSSELLQTFREIFSLNAQILDLIALDQILQSQVSDSLLISLGVSQTCWLSGRFGYRDRGAVRVEACELAVEGAGARFFTVGLSREMTVFFEQWEEDRLLRVGGWG